MQASSWGIDLLRDSRGNFVTDRDGTPMVVDEYGKVVSFKEGMAHLKRQNDAERTKYGCMGCILGLIFGYLIINIGSVKEKC